MKLSDRELATVLAALRLFQCQPDLPDAIQVYFTEHQPLSKQRIDQLCSRLNTVEVSAVR